MFPLPWHLGALHPFEQVLTLLLAFGPFVALAVVVVVRRRQDAREEQQESGRPGASPIADRASDGSR